MASEERRPFEREENQLVSLESYRAYLVDKPEDVPLMLPPKIKHPVFVRQHIYFTDSSYRQEGVQDAEKDWDKVWMRNFSYNQIIMRREQEIRLHSDHEREVEPPPPETMRGTLDELSRLDVLGASILGKLIALKPEVKTILFPEENMPVVLADTTPGEKALFFDELVTQAIEELTQPTVTPQIVISSAMKRMATLLGNRDLHAEADARLRQEETYYPLRMPKLSTLYYLGNQLLIDAIGEGQHSTTEPQAITGVAA